MIIKTYILPQNQFLITPLHTVNERGHGLNVTNITCICVNYVQLDFRRQIIN